MVEREDWRQLSTLPVELKVHLGFREHPEQQEWLIHDEMTEVGGVELYEWLPARARVNREGTRYEVGARKEDVEGLLALARIINPQAQGLDRVRDFWQDHPKFSVREEDDWMYIGTNMEPTPIAFETEFGPVQQAYDLALTAAIKNMTYEEMKAHDWHGSWMEYAENPTQRTLLFTTLFDEITRGQESSSEIDPERIVTADNLRDFPLATYKTSIHFAPGTLIRNGIPKELKDVYVMAHNGSSEVDIIDTDARYNRETKEWEHDDFRLKLPIPEGLDVRTVDDLQKLGKGQIMDDKNEVLGEADVAITVEDNSFRIVSADGAIDLEVRTPACDDCKTPTWKFPWPDADPEDDFEASRKKFSMHSVNTSLGVYRCQVSQDGEQKTYCVDCVGKLEEKYAQDHPFVLRPRAIAVARRRLDEMDYNDVEIWEDQVWRTGQPGWEFFTKLEYERDGRKITRYTGTPTLTDEGKFDPQMFPREYIEFQFR